jgi:hypothetical protein
VSKSLPAQQGIEHESVQHIANRGRVGAGVLGWIARDSRSQSLRKASADLRRLPRQYVRRRMQTEIAFRFHPPGEALPAPRCFPFPILSGSMDFQQFFNCGL